MAIVERVAVGLSGEKGMEEEDQRPTERTGWFNKCRCRSLGGFALETYSVSAQPVDSDSHG